MDERTVRAATGAWSAATAMAGLIWAAGGPGFPFDDRERATRMGAVLAGLDPLPTGLVIAALGVAGTVLVALLSRRPRLRLAGWPAAVVLLLMLPDGRLLLAAGELLMLRGDRVEAAAVAQAWFAAGGVCWAAIAHRGRPATAPAWGRPVTLLAAALPLGYAVPRALWAAGHPFGLDAATTAMVSSPAGRTRELVFACAAAGGGLLTLGLIQRWGVRMLGLPVPRLLAVVPAAAVAVILTAAGVTMWRSLAQFDPANWAAWAGNLVWLPWGVTLGLATWAYHQRRTVAAPDQV
ncbi:hypothetical protein [Catenuloplanes atrovinosus]|uniref:Uncharacterized protein n=1 Tax=Catenuloplanes atrovinosus TaxID=137266 RepID=A0AAE4CA22_9ACTN|nr:hypothetical protein [Catenuloplanes atrovinosus]MDR7277166.1 hypothetical protein [Catenuloplanes atrovinosus]